jgi:hypothetical protein
MIILHDRQALGIEVLQDMLGDETVATRLFHPQAKTAIF